MLKYGVVASILYGAFTKAPKKQLDMINLTLNVRSLEYNDTSTVSGMLNCKSEIYGAFVANIEKVQLNDYAFFLNALVDLLDPQKYSQLVSVLISQIQESLTPEHSFGYGNKTVQEFCSQSSIILTEFLAEILFHCVIKIENKKGGEIKYKDLGKSLIESATPVDIKIIEKQKLGIDTNLFLKTSGLEKDFLNVFESISDIECTVGGHTSVLNVYSLPVQNGEILYEGFDDLLTKGIEHYVLTHMERKELVENGKQGATVLKAINKLKRENITQREFLGFLVFLFMENALKAPKVFSRVQLTKIERESVDSNCDGVYILSKDGKYQLILGTSDIKDNMFAALECVIEFASCMKDNRNSISTLTNSIASKLMDEKTARQLVEIIKNIRIGQKSETSFGIIIGYSPLINEAAVLEYGFEDTYYSQIKADIKELLPVFKNKIIEKGLYSYDFYLYLVPFKAAEEKQDELQRILIEGDFV